MADKQSKAKLCDSKKFRRKYLTWMRMFRYGVNNFTRNAWLTTAATAVMTITLLIVFTTITARTMLNDTVTQLRENINLSIFLRSDIEDRDVSALTKKLEAVDNVKRVTFVSSEQGRKTYIKDNLDPNDIEGLKTLAESEIAFPAKFDINVENPDELDGVESLIKDDKLFKENLFDGAKQLDGDKRSAIKTISSWLETAEKAGLFATVIFVAISMLIVFNTIRMAIFNRRDEIEMMKLIGADKGFIRGPFVVEAVMYGFFAALIATTLGYVGLMTLQSRVAEYGISVDGVIDMLTVFAPLILIAMILLGALIGMISSRLAVRRYLKV
jgi:cell division transport system permease protein